MKVVARCRETQVGKSQRVKIQRVKTSENFAEEKMFAQDISEDLSEDRRDHFYCILEYLWISSRNLHGRLLSSEKFSEDFFFSLWVFTLELFQTRDTNATASCESSAAPCPPLVAKRISGDRQHAGPTAAFPLETHTSSNPLDDHSASACREYVRVVLSLNQEYYRT